jgi:hypothetical protein
MFDPIGMYMNPSLRTGLATVAARESAGIIASSKGNAKVTPAPRKNVRLASAFFVMIIAISSFEMVCF